MCFATATAAFAQMPAYTKAGPVPPALTTAKSVFVSNGGDLFPGRYSGGHDRAYTQFLAALGANHSFALVDDPAKADLVLELSLIDFPSAFASDVFRLVVYGAKSHYVLWTITSSIALWTLQRTGDKNFDAALDGVLSQFLQITGKTPAPAH
jgi:hypothetical protein